MGADGGIYYYEDSDKNPFFTQLLNALLYWLYSDHCQIQFDESLCVNDNTICKYNDLSDKTEDNAAPFFTIEQLGFLNLIKSHIMDYCSNYSNYPDELSEYFLTWEQFWKRQDTDDSFCGLYRDDFDNLMDINNEINHVYEKSGSMWFYWDTNSLHTNEPFESNEFREFDELYDSCMKCIASSETFKKIFSDKNIFRKFVTEYLPTPDYIQIWT